MDKYIGWIILALVFLITWAVFPAIANWQTEGLGIQGEPMTHGDALVYIIVSFVVVLAYGILNKMSDNTAKKLDRHKKKP